MIPSDIQIVPATQEHATAMAADLRAGDLREMQRLGLDPLEVLTTQVAASNVCCFTALRDGVPVAIWGAATTSLLFSDTARCWMLSGSRIVGREKALMEVSRDTVKILQEQFEVLHAWADKDYRQAVRYIEWMGFKHVDDFAVGEVRVLHFERHRHGH